MDDKRKQSLYFPESMLQDIRDEAIRQDRSISWMVQIAWSIARERIAQFPNADGSVPNGKRESGGAA
jgi:uncharacterized small protein (TIGR04563 family)